MTEHRTPVSRYEQLTAAGGPQNHMAHCTQLLQQKEKMSAAVVLTPRRSISNVELNCILCQRDTLLDVTLSLRGVAAHLPHHHRQVPQRKLVLALSTKYNHGNGLGSSGRCSN